MCNICFHKCVLLQKLKSELQEESEQLKRVIATHQSTIKVQVTELKKCKVITVQY